jgi:hypothetical protein
MLVAITETYVAPTGMSGDCVLGGPTAKRLASLLQRKMYLLMWWTVPAPGNEVP